MDDQSSGDLPPPPPPIGLSPHLNRGIDRPRPSPVSTSHYSFGWESPAPQRALASPRGALGINDFESDFEAAAPMADDAPFVAEAVVVADRPTAAAADSKSPPLPDLPVTAALVPSSGAFPAPPEAAPASLRRASRSPNRVPMPSLAPLASACSLDGLLDEPLRSGRVA